MQNQIKSDFEKAKKLREPHESEIREAYEMVKDSRMFSYQGEHQGQAKARTRRDATVRKAARNLVTNIQRLLIPQNRRWSDIQIENQYREEIGTTLDKRIREANDYMYREYLGSQFFLAITESLWDAVISGVGCIQIIDQDGEPIEFASIPVDELYFLEDQYHQVDQTFRRHELTPRQYQQRYQVEVEEKQTILQVVKPCKSGYQYIEYNLTEDETLVSKTTPWNPFVVFRWERDTDSPWGDSPVRAALPHVILLNNLLRDHAVMSEYAAHGVWQVDDEFGNVENLKDKMIPGSVIPMPQGTELRPLPFPGNFNVTIDLIRMEQEAIKTILLDYSLPSEDALKYMTAEALQRQRQQFMQYIGEPAQRLGMELLRPLGEQVFNRLLYRGDLLIVSLEEIKGLGIPEVESQYDLFKVDVNAAIHRANKAQEAQNGVQAILQLSQAVMSIPQQVAVHLNMDKLIPDTLLAFDIDPEHLADPKTSKALIEEMGGQAKLMQMLNMASQGAGIAKDASDAGLL